MKKQIEVRKSEYKFTQWDELKTYDFNSLKEASERDVSKLKNAIVNSKFSFPFYVWKRFVIDGAGRKKALEELEQEGYTIPELPVIEVEASNKREAKKLVLQASSEHGEVTKESLDLFIEDLELTDIELGEFNFDLPDLSVKSVQEEELKAKEDNFEVSEEIATDIVKGDLFEFKKDGKVLHRLMCGDSIDVGDVEKLMGGEKADLAHNDPPYGMKKEKDGVKNDNLNFDDLLQFNKDWINLQFAYLKDNGSWYCWGIDEPLMDIYSHILKPLIKTQKATFRNLITWEKIYSKTGTGDAMGMGSKDLRMYPVADEKCLFVMRGVQGFNNNADNYFEGWDSIVNYLDEQKNKAELTIKDCKRLAGHSEKSGCHWFDKSQWSIPTEAVYNSWKTYCQQNNIDAFKRPYTSLDKEYKGLKQEYDELKKEYYSTRAYFNNTHDNMNNVWHFERTSNAEREGVGGHATPKPIALCERVIKSSCPENGLVIDFFLGSGSTMVASHQLNRRCFGMELEPKYCQVIIDRMKKLDADFEIVCTK